MKCPECEAAIENRFESFRLIDWQADGLVTIETSVGLVVRPMEPRDEWEGYCG